MFSTIFKKKYFNQQFFLITLLVLLLLSIPFISLATTTATQYPAKDVTFWQALTAGLSNSLGTLTLLITSLFARLFVMAALIFDNLLAIGLSTGFFKSSFVNEAWSSVRDFANVAFILGFLFVAFKVMLGQESRWEQTFIKIIIAALVMNFSLFLSLAVVDAGNITARVFYNAIGTDYNKSTDANNFIKDRFLIARKFYENTEQKDLSFKSISGYFQSFVKPEKLFGVNSFKAWKAKGGGGANIISFMFLNGVVIAYFIMLSKTLFKGGFMFLSRIVWLVYYVIISPLALISMFLPSASSYWSSWLKNIANKSFCIVVYLFLLWLAALIMKSGIADMNSDDFWMMIAVFIFKAIIVYEILDMATKQGSKMCGDSGFLMKGAVGLAGLAAKPLGLFGGGLAGIAGRRIIGGLGRSMHQNEDGLLYNMSTKGGALGWGANKMRLYGKDLENKKFFGKSLDDVDTEAHKSRQQLRDMFKKEDRPLFDAGVAGGADIRRLNEDDKKNYHGFVDQTSLEEFLTDLEGKNLMTTQEKTDVLNGKSLKDVLTAAGKNQPEINDVLSKHYDKAMMEKVGGASSILKHLTGQRAYTTKEERIKEIKAEKGKKRDKISIESGNLAVAEARALNTIATASSEAVHLKDDGEISRIVKSLAANNPKKESQLETELRKMVDTETKHTKIFKHMDDSLAILENAQKSGNVIGTKIAKVDALKTFNSLNSDDKNKILSEAGTSSTEFESMSTEEKVKVLKTAYNNSQKKVTVAKQLVEKTARELTTEQQKRIRGEYKTKKDDLKREVEKNVDDTNTQISATVHESMTSKTSARDVNQGESGSNN